MREVFIWVGGMFTAVLTAVIIFTICSIDLGIHQDYASAAMWNEEISHTVVSTTPEEYSLIPGKALYMQGSLEASDSVENSLVGYSAQALRLQRRVEFFSEWQEKVNEQVPGGGVVEGVRTVRDWSLRTPQEGKPAGPKIGGRTVFPEAVTLGRYTLSPELYEPILDEEFVPVELWNHPWKQGRMMGEYYLYFGENPDAPAIGDMRVSLTQVPLGTVSLVAWENDKRLIPSPKARREQAPFWIVRGEEKPDQIFSLQSLLLGEPTFLAYNLFFPFFLALPWMFLVSVLNWMRRSLNWSESPLTRFLDWNSSYRLLLPPFFLHFAVGTVAALGTDVRLALGNLGLCGVILFLVRKSSVRPQ